MEYQIHFTNRDEVGPVEVWGHAETRVHLWAEEVMKDAITSLIMQIANALSIGSLVTGNLQQSSLTQRERVTNLFAIVRSIDTLSPGAIEKAFTVLLNLEGNQILSNGIRASILKAFPRTVQIELVFDWIQTIPAKPAYYIPRTISSRARLDTAFLKEGTGDVLLFSGIERTELSSLLGGEMVERSSTQTRGLTCHRILLESDNHFRRIAALTPKNVHWIRREGANFFWVKSKGNVRVMQGHIHPEQKQFTEEEFVEQLGRDDTTPVCIADSPGMGKSLLLASLAQKLQDRYPEKRVLFFVLRELIPKLEEEAKAEENYLLSLVLNCVDVKKGDERILVKGKLAEQIETCHFELFFDGFDELLSGQVDVCKRLLQSLLKVPNCRVHVTTRLHMLEQLELTLGVLGYNILPFTPEQQKKFLQQCWITEHKARDTRQLLEFAKECLKAIKSNLSDVERDIAGIPLQCFMLADVYADDAVEYSSGAPMPHLNILVKSVFDLFQKLFKKKFSRISEEFKPNDLNRLEHLKEYHVQAAFQLLFPDNPEMRALFVNTKLSEEEMSMVFSIGLVEPNLTSATPRFVHRTFAECLIAEFLVKGLPYRDSDSASDSRSTSFLFQNVFHALQNRTFDIEFYAFLQLRIEGHCFQHPVINSFIDCYLHDNLDAIQYNQLNELIRFISSDVLIPCAVNHLLNTFEFISRAMHTFHIPQPNLGDLCFTSASYCTNWKMVEKVVQFSGNVSEITANIKGFNFTPVHAGVHRGTYSVSKYLLELYETTLPPGVLHCCLEGSWRDSESVINEKKEIIDMIVGANRSAVEEVWFGGTPILSWQASPVLVQRLITLGAEVNKLDRFGRTVLHKINYKIMTPTRFSQFCELLRSRGFQFWGHADSTSGEWTPLHFVVRYVDVERAALVCFKEGGADFKANTTGGTSVLQYAVRRGRNYDCIKLLCEFGADIWGHDGGMNLCYFAAKHRNYDALVYLTERDECNRKINQFITEDGNTALHRAAVIGFHEGVKILVENGADMYARNREGDIPLISALKDQRRFNINVFREMERKGFKTVEYIPEILHQLIMTRKDEEHVPDDIHELVLRCLEVLRGCSSSTTTSAQTSEEAEVVIETLADYIHAIKRRQVANCFFGILQKLLDDFLTGRNYSKLPAGVINFMESSNKTRTLFIETFDPDVCHNKIRELLSIRNPTCDHSFCLDHISTFVLKESNKIVELKQRWVSELQSGASKVIIIGSEFTEETRTLLGDHETVMDSLEWNDLALTLQYKLLWHLLTPTQPNFQHCRFSRVHFCKLLKNSQLSKLITSSFNQRVDLSAHLNEFVTGLVNEMDENSLAHLESISFRQLFPGTSNDLKTGGSTLPLTARVMNKLISYNVVTDEGQVHIKLKECMAWFFVSRKLLGSRNDGEQSSLPFTLDNFISKIQNRKDDCDCATFLHYPYDLILFYFDWLVGKKASVNQIKSMYLVLRFFKSIFEHRAENLISLASDHNILSQLGYNHISVLIDSVFYVEENYDLTMAEESVLQELAKIRKIDLFQGFISFIQSSENALEVLHPRRRMVLLECILESGTDPVAHAENILKDKTTPVSQLIEFAKYLVTRGLTQALYTQIGNRTTAVHQILHFSADLNTELFQTLKDAGFDFNVLDGDGQNLLDSAIWGQKNVEVIKALVECGTDFNHTDKYGQTLIHLLVQSSSIHGYGDYDRVLHYLIGLGIDANTKDYSGITPLDFLEMRSFKRNAEKEGIRRILESAIAHQHNNS